ncbi:MAG: hypothetical protein ACI9JM_002713 [Halioglobus sp.]|jgi:hypothetical protein
MSEQKQIEQDKAELRAAWDDLIANLQDARDIIDSPDRLAPESTSRVLAEGYRYLAGFVHHGIERTFHGSAEFPSFRNALSIFNKSTIENADAIYFYAPIDGRYRYLVKGKAEDFSHWRGEARPEQGPYAPQYLIFETANGPMSGDSGDLRELTPGFRTGFGTLDTATLKIDDNGEFEIMLGPDKPDDYSGNFICTVKGANKRDPGGDDRYASFISGRQLFYDWENEDAIHLSITNLDRVGGHPEPLTPAKCAEELRKMGSIVNGHMRFWLDFYDKLLNVNFSHGGPEDGKYFYQKNGYNKPNVASSDTGGGMSTNVYAGGLFDLAENEALYIEATYSGDPVYVSVHLGNLWGESPDYANHQSSMNLHQMYMGEDHVQRWLVSHKDPGVQNWLDTTGLPRGSLSHRWAYSEIPDEKDFPTVTAKKIRLDEVDAYFPQDMPRLTPAERAVEIGVRQAHVQRRYRVF